MPCGGGRARPRNWRHFSTVREVSEREGVKAALRKRIDRRKFGRIRWVRKARELRLRDAPLHRHLGYLLADPEVDNFTYDLANDRELAAWLAETFGVPDEEAMGLIAEARNDRVLQSRIDAAAASRRWSMKARPLLGRRLGWYAIVRLLKPRRVIETGTHDGLGSLVILAALDRNGREHDIEGQLVSLDLDPRAGWMVGRHPRFTRIIGSTSETLAPALREQTDILLHDSDHSYEYERFELSLAAEAMVPTLLSDNSHVTTALRDVCRERGGHYSFFQERPRDHFYPGGGIGVGVLPQRSS